MNDRADSPIATLAAAIEETALRCAEPLQQRMAFPTDHEQKESWIQIVWEHVFLFMHLVNRNAYGVLPEAIHGRLMGELAPTVVIPLATELSDGGPDDVRQRIVNEAFEGLNRSEREYAGCEAFLAEPILTGNSLVSVFARKVFRLAGGAEKPELVAEFVKRVVEAYKSLALRDRMAAISVFLQAEAPPAG